MDNLIELTRDEMRNIKAGRMAGGTCHCYCCTSDGDDHQVTPGYDTGVSCDGGPGSHNDCQSYCSSNGGHCEGGGSDIYVCALCQ